MAKRTTVFRDLAVVLVGAAAALAAAFYFDAFEEYERWAQKYERWQVDEFVAVPVVLALVLGFFYWSRWRVLKGEVAERERAEEALRRSEERFRSLIQNASDIITVLDADGTIRYQSLAVEPLMGYGPGELVGENAFGYVHPDDLERALGAFAESLGSPEAPVRAEFRFRRKDGSWRHLEATGSNLLSDPAVGGVVINTRDVTERKRAEEALRLSEERYRAVVERSMDGIFMFDGDTGRVLDANPALHGMLGYAPEELRGMRLHDVVAHDPEEVDRNARLALREGHRFVGDRKYRKKDGSLLDVEVGASAIPHDGGGAVCAVVRDTTGRKRAEEELRRSERELAEAQRIAHVGNWSLEVAENRLDWSDEMYRIAGFAPREFVVTVEGFLGLVHPDDREFLGEAVRAALEGDEDSRGLDFRLVRPGGEVRFVRTEYEVERDGSGRPVRLLGATQDVTERKTLEGELEYQALHDPLTGLPNRALFSDRLGHALSRAEREGDRVAVLFVDLDDFKYVNDSLGHEAGDRLLVAAAERLRTALRPGDTAARFGGDEFAVLLEGVGGAGEAERVAGRIVEGLREPFVLGGGQEVFVTPSIGIAAGGGLGGGGAPEDLLRRADLAMYEAKRGGKARYALFDPETERRSVRRLRLENGLRRAIERDELVVRYQPVVSLKTGRIAGMEALVRWEHPERGLILPKEFVPLAEENGLIVPVGRWVLREACRQTKTWQESRPSDPPPVVGVNLSAVQLKHPDLVGDVGRILEETGLDPGRLTLEVTESVLVEDAGRHASALRGLSDLGVRFAIDDFGTGYSSLSYLKRLPAGLLKLSGSFVRGIEEGAGEDEVLLSGVVGIAHGLGLTVCAEGVETPEQAARVEALGCDLAQGNLFSGPLPPQAAGALLAEGPPS